MAQEMSEFRQERKQDSSAVMPRMDKMAQDSGAVMVRMDKMAQDSSELKQESVQWRH